MRLKLPFYHYYFTKLCLCICLTCAMVFVLIILCWFNICSLLVSSGPNECTINVPQNQINLIGRNHNNCCFNSNIFLGCCIIVDEWWGKKWWSSVGLCCSRIDCCWPWTKVRNHLTIMLWASYSSWRHRNTALLKCGQALLHGCTFVQWNIGSW